MCFHGGPTYLESQLLEFPGYSGRMKLLLLFLRFFLSVLKRFLLRFEAGNFSLLQRKFSVLLVLSLRFVRCTTRTRHHSAFAVEQPKNSSVEVHLSRNSEHLMFQKTVKRNSNPLMP